MSCPILYSNLIFKIGQDFLNMQYYILKKIHHEKISSEDPVLGQLSDPGLYTSNEGRPLKFYGMNV